MSRIPRVPVIGIRGGVHGKKQKNYSYTFYTILFLYYNIFKIIIPTTYYIILLSIGLGRIFNHQFITNAYAVGICTRVVVHTCGLFDAAAVRIRISITAPPPVATRPLQWV